MPSSKYTKCTYLKRDGTICNKGSIGGICGVHSQCNPQKPCRNCGKGTQSVTGYCNTLGECRLSHHAITLRFFRAARRAARYVPPQAASREVVTDADLDALVEELLE